MTTTTPTTRDEINRAAILHSARETVAIALQSKKDSVANAGLLIQDFIEDEAETHEVLFGSASVAIDLRLWEDNQSELLREIRRESTSLRSLLEWRMAPAV